MKRTLVSTTFAAFAAIVFFASCKKDSSATALPASATISTSTSTVAVGDTFTVKTSNIVSGTSSLTSLKWVISPATGGASVRIMGDSVRISFTTAGTYTIAANVSDSLTHTQIAVSNPVSITVTPQVITAIQTGDVLNLKPVLNVSDTGGIYLNATSTMSYADTNYVFSYSTSLTVNSYSLNIGGVVYPAGAAHTGNKGVVTTSFNLGNPAAGTYSISINWLNKVYTGSLSVIGTKYTFTWDNTTAVRILPLSVSR